MLGRDPTVHRPPPPAALAWSVWALGAALYLAGFFQRVAPAVMTRELMAEFAIAAAGLGQLSAYYLYSYVAMQIPTGLMVDRFGARRVLAAGAALAALGSFLFALAPGLAAASLGRLLVGGSVGVAWVGTLKLAAHWLPPQRFALATGLALAAGMTGAVTAGVPLAWAVAAFGWRAVMLAAAVAIALIAVAIGWLVRDDPSERGYASWFAGAEPAAARASIRTALVEALGYRNTWLVFLAPQGMVGACLAIGGLWGVPWLVSVYGFTPARAAFYCSALMLAWAAGGPAFGALSDRLRLRKPFYLAGSSIAFALWALVILWPEPLAPALLFALLVGAGFASGCMVVGFALAKESVPARLAGTASGIANMGSMAGAMLLQPLLGLVLDLNWRGALAGAVRVYDAAAYRAAFLLVLVWLAVSLVAAAFLRETGGRQRV
ncbi:MAG: MFS transporter [Pseudomonadota bacterium]